MTNTEPTLNNEEIIDVNVESISGSEIQDTTTETIAEVQQQTHELVVLSEELKVNFP
ncbi:MAG: hypothetical protein U9Q66_04540 [Patescibacteria group bacterium]|nr:hypothetical protein [Patescibacteria group bacterium]